MQRARPKERKVESGARLAAAVNEGLTRHWSPRQIAHRLVVDHPHEVEWRGSHEAVDQALYCQARGTLTVQLTGALRRGGTRRVGQAERTALTERRQQVIPNMVLISERRGEVADRAVPGHWAGNLIMGAGNASAIITVVERTTRYAIWAKVPYDHSAPRVALLLSQAMGRLPALLRRSLTWDQARQMARHADFTIATNIPVFFADPHSPWQRGTNENTNGLLREFFPKGTDLWVHSQTDLDNVAYLLNTRPRETLNWLKPAEKLDLLLLESGDALTG